MYCYKNKSSENSFMIIILTINFYLYENVSKMYLKQKSSFIIYSYGVVKIIIICNYITYFLQFTRLHNCINHLNSLLVKIKCFWEKMYIEHFLKQKNIKFLIYLFKLYSIFYFLLLYFLYFILKKLHLFCIMLSGLSSQYKYVKWNKKLQENLYRNKVFHL